MWTDVHRECPTAWSLYGSEEYGTSGDWKLVHRVKHHRTEAATFKYLNFTVDDPGYYRFYMWVFYDAVAGNNDGHQLRQIIPNPSGYSVHYGEKWTAPANATAALREQSTTGPHAG